jgi:starch-binding outer membrane protein, SusD/RagB family
MSIQRPLATAARTRLSALLAGGALVAGLAGCEANNLNVPNTNSVTPEAASAQPLQALQFFATGIVGTHRNNTAAHIRDIGLFGREVWYFQLQDGRWTTGYFRDFADNTSFGAGGTWGAAYGNLRNIYNFNAAVASAGSLSPQQVAAARGFAQTFEAMELLRIINTRHDLGAVTTLQTALDQYSPFVSRDSTFRYITNTLDAAATNLTNGGAAFPFTLPTTGGSGFTGFSTPATFLRFNRALKARVEAYRASLGCGATCYQAASTALAASFVTPTLSAATLNNGAYNLYSSAAGDALNGVWSIRNDLFANMSITTDADLPRTDARLTAKLVTTASRSQAGSDASTLLTNVYPANTSSIPIIDNEELWLLQAEVQWFTGNQAGALTTLNTVAQVAGGATGNRYTGITTNDAFVTALLAERRLSLFLEGHRWIDVRRFGRIASLPNGGTGFTVARQQVIPQAECQARAVTGNSALAGPGC